MTNKDTPEEFYGLKHIRLNEDDLSKLMFFGNIQKNEEFLQVADKCIEVIKQSDNIRLVVLETWIFLDYSVRELLISAIDSSGINHEDYDLKRNALPTSFRACVELLINIRRTNEKLLPDPDVNKIKLPAKFLIFLKDKHTHFFNQLVDIEKEYYQKHYPELAINSDAININILSEDIKYRHISEYWLEVTKRVDDSWKNMAMKLNKARDFAAHSHNVKKISEQMGFAGNNQEKLIRNECLRLIEALLGIKLKV